MVQENERHQVNEASAIRKLEATLYVIDVLFIISTAFLTLEQKLKAARCAEMDAFWQNHNLRVELKRAESTIELFRGMSGFDPLALAKYIPARPDIICRRLSELEPVSVAGTAQSVIYIY